MLLFMIIISFIDGVYVNEDVNGVKMYVDVMSDYHYHYYSN